MKNVTIAAFAMVLGVLFFSSDAFGQRRPGNINARQRNQQERIASGIKSGQLNAREAYRLEREQAQIARQERRFRNSGDGLSNRERLRLERELNQSNRHIYNQKHDKQDYPRY